MNVHHLLFFCFSSALCGGNTGLVRAANIYTGPEGGNGSISCYLTLHGDVKFFCKDKCETDDDILMKTDGVTAQSGRYSMTYENGSSGRGILSVAITRLTRSDSGLYRCGLGKSLVPDSYSEFKIRVSDELDKTSGFVRTETEGGKVTYGCSGTVYGKRKFFCKNQCQRDEDVLIDTTDATAESGRYSIKYEKGSAFELYVTVAQVTTSDTGRYRCGYGAPSSPDSYLNFQIVVMAASSPTASTPQTTTTTPSSPPPEATDQCPGYVLPLVVWAPLVGGLLSAVFLLLLCVCRTRNSGLNTRGNAAAADMEFPNTYENWGPASKHEDSVYQSLEPPSKDQDQTSQ